MDTNQIEDTKIRFKKSFLIYMIAFTILLQLIFIFGKSIETNLSIKVLITLLPIIPFIFALSSMVSMVKSDDEMFKKITSDAFILTGCITLVWTLAAGLFQQVLNMPHFSVFYVYFIMLMTFSFSYLFISKKYT